MGYSIKQEAAFYIGQPVYVKTDPDQSMCLVVAYRVTQKTIYYECSKGMNTMCFAEIELSDTKNVVNFM